MTNRNKRIIKISKKLDGAKEKISHLKPGNKNPKEKTNKNKSKNGVNRNKFHKKKHGKEMMNRIKIMV